MAATESLARNLGRIHRQDPELALWAAILVKHFGHEDNYTLTGSSERDTEAALNGEFKGSFEDSGEPALKDLVEPDVPSNFDDFVEELLEEESVVLEGERGLYA